MWVFVFILILIALVKLLDDSFAAALLSAMVAFMIAAVKIKLAQTALEKKYLRLEQRFNALLKEVEHVEVSSVDRVNITQESMLSDGSRADKHANIALDEALQNAHEDKTSGTLSSSHESDDKAGSAFVWLMPLVSTIRNYFSSGNPLVKIGGLVLFFGISFLIKYFVSQVA